MGNVIKNNLYMLRMIWAASPMKVIFNILIQVLLALLDFLTGIYFLRITIEIIESGRAFTEFLFFAVLILALNTFRGISVAWYYFYANEMLNVQVQNVVSKKIFNKSLTIDFAHTAVCQT